MSSLLSLPSNPAGRTFVIVAYIEALTWTGLLVGMFLKYASDTTERVVDIFGPIHGLAFIIYVVVTILTSVAFRWPLKVTLIALLAAIPPLATIPAEGWIAKRGLLELPATSTSSP